MSSADTVIREKVPRTMGSRFSFLRTKRTIAVLVILTCAVITLIALAAAHVIGDSSDQHLSAVAGSNNDAQPQTTSGSNDNDAAATASSLAPAQTHISATKASATLSPKSSTTATSSTSGATSTVVSVPGSIANGTSLRIMCLGASVVKGETSPGTVGFRPTLRDEVAALGAPVNMVGSVSLGDMIDNDIEAYGGFKISQIFNAAKKVVPQMQPNVFVINDGTNNVLQQKEIATAGADMEKFINYLLTASPRSFVVLSTLLINTVGNGALEPDIEDINQQFRDLMKKFEKEGKPVVLAELHPSTGLPDRPQTSDIGPDGSHPTVNGYQIMGHLLAEAIIAGDKQGLLQVPVDNGIADYGEKEKATAATTASTAKRTATPRRRRRV
ncbi:SGNH hydrolase-type esterase domain-containing protein [Pseudomassariella vexata]|uniref:SGNH hydrolase-type esterase domain-containing protein n=1 Tax=Pseudomassariella vexata TaxID=1141098 RepID=A0A1Y2D9K2_9PEZI|nr:SGNH hydrolase-type esterase domain-containing protein [Pseudomassariella vexata]ORY55940.1 SGNH hydrolase-type esterase domain-containing protein [Pseudomassariella vexata]